MLGPTRSWRIMKQCVNWTLGRSKDELVNGIAAFEFEKRTAGV